MNTYQHFGGVVCRGYSWPGLTADGVAFFVDRKMKTKGKHKLTHKHVVIGQTGIVHDYKNEHPLLIIADAIEHEQRARELRFLAECKGQCSHPDYNEMSVHYVAWHELDIASPAEMARN